MVARLTILAALVLAPNAVNCFAQTDAGGGSQVRPETEAERDARLAWWREARFGLFIHWGLYAIPAGEWAGRTGHGEWIRETAQVAIEEYDQFVGQFNPVRFDAERWVRTAKDAGMKYIVITSKHHDGFCLFDSKFTDYDVMSTPFKRDILKELSEACQRAGIRMCWYHSIMDWHHPDYLPRRGWEKRSAEGASYDRYVEHMKNQLRELLTNYGPIGVLWFDGEWEDTWTHERGVELYNYVRGLQPSIIINNRVDVGRGGMAGMTRDPRFAGDFGTPEQEIPPSGFPGVDWETCMTMNDHWGYNKHDQNWKSSKDLIQMLVDIASKGGNFLLNVGPTAEGEFPPASVERLRDIGAWMKVSGEAIYGTQASPFKTLPWGRCTQKALPGNLTRLYLHVFDWPANGKLIVSALLNDPKGADILGPGARQSCDVKRDGDALVVSVPRQAPNPIDTVIVLDIVGRPDVGEPPVIKANWNIFVDTLDVSVTSSQENVELRCTTDGSDPGPAAVIVRAPLKLSQTTTVRARAFRGDKPVSGVSETTFTKVAPRPADKIDGLKPGVEYDYYEGTWDKLPDFDKLTPVKSGVLAGFEFSPRRQAENFAFRYRGYVTVPRTGVYQFFTLSDDGSQLYIGDKLVVDNDGLHGMAEAAGVIALEAGAHPITVTFFEKTGNEGLEVWYAGPGLEKQRLPNSALSHKPAAGEQPPGRSEIVTPHPRQLAWQEMELHAFVHFGMNTFTNREWGDGTEDPKLFNPTQFDARQWMRALKAAGMKQVVVTAKHHDGFCLWPSKYTEHSVKNSPWRDGKGDIVREVAEACRAEGLKLGIYLSPWDRHEPSYGDSPRYNEHYKNQLTELLTNYGPIYEVWFDGACGEGPSGKKQVYDWDGYVEVVRRLQPEAVIFSDAGPDVRWVGNEDGLASATNWSMLRRDEFSPGTSDYKLLGEGQEDGTHWVPCECDVSIRPGWFYHPDQDDQVKSLAQLLDIYYRSVGQNAVLLD
jgi:alpha-L-fucosidase